MQLYSSILWLIFSLMAQSVQMPTSHNTQHADFTSCSGSIKSRFTFSVQSNCARVHLKVRPPCLGLGTGSFDPNPSAIVVFSPDRMRKCVWVRFKRTKLCIWKAVPKDKFLHTCCMVWASFSVQNCLIVTIHLHTYSPKMGMILPAPSLEVRKVAGK